MSQKTLLLLFICFLIEYTYKPYVCLWSFMLTCFYLMFNLHIGSSRGSSCRYQSFILCLLFCELLWFISQFSFFSVKQVDTSFSIRYKDIYNDFIYVCVDVNLILCSYYWLQQNELYGIQISRELQQRLFNFLMFFSL